MTRTSIQEIASLNDAFRKQLGLPIFGKPPVPGGHYMTRGIMDLPPEAVIDICARVRSFDSFTEDNDPYGEHDFGAFDHPQAGKVFWKIDYYAGSETKYGSEDPSDPDKSYRVLTVLLAEEY